MVRPGFKKQNKTKTNQKQTNKNQQNSLCGKPRARTLRGKMEGGLLPDASLISPREKSWEMPLHATCPLALPFLAAAALVFGQLFWVSRCFTGSFGIFNGFL